MNTHSPPPANEPGWMDGVELAAHLGGVPLKTIERWRYTGTGPPAYRIGKHVRYDRREVDEWVRSHAVSGRDGFA